MMYLSVEYRGKHEQVILYDLWDLAEDEEYVTPTEFRYPGDVGKFILYSDGSNMLSKYIHDRGDYIRGSGGLVHKWEYVSICRAKIAWAGYSGLYYAHEHIALRRPNERERRVAEGLLKNKHNPKDFVTKRVAMLVLKELQKHLFEKDITEEWIIKQLKEEATKPKNRGADRLEAIKMLARIGGVEIGGIGQAPRGQTPLFQQFNIQTIQDQRREEIDIPGRNEIIEIVSAVATIEDTPLDELSEDKEIIIEPL